MRNIKSIFIYLLVFTLSFLPLFSKEKKLTEEQMTAYRTKPAVVLIYSGLFIEITFGNGNKATVPNYGSGSGFFINQDGYLVTNGHVVQTYVEYTNDKAKAAQKVLDDFVINTIVNNFKQQYGRNPSPSELENAYKDYMKKEDPRLTNHGPINYVILSNNQDYNFEVKKYSPSIPEGGKDIAVLKIERDNCPIIMLGDSADLTIQQRVFTIGYPGVVDPSRFPLLGPENTLRSTITGGAITALKTDYKGMSVIQHDAATSPGNSGGPTVDSQGRVVGVHSYAATEQAGFKFCVPINTAKEFIRETGVEINQPSEFTKIFNELMDAVWSEKWFDAQSKVAIALTYMENQPDLKKLQQTIQMEISQMGVIAKIWMKYKVLVILVVVLVLVLVGISVRRKKVSLPSPAIKREKKGAYLLGQSGPLMGNKFPVGKGSVRIGRDSARCQIVLTDETVSREHAVVEPTPDGKAVRIRGLSGTNPTYVNDRAITEAELKEGDQVRIGKTIFLFKKE
ncbi:MAG: trypsin-like peptidase domain-containing protein [Candidatus Aminicenantales bacterium]